MKLHYYPETDSLYIELRDALACRTVELAEDVLLDIGADGEPVGYDIQHASTKPDLVAAIVLGQLPAAAE